MSIYKAWAIGSSFAMILLLSLFPNFLHAQEVALTDGLNWLIANQDVSGLWGVDKKTPLRDGSVVLEIISKLGTEADVLNNGVTAIHSRPTNSSDYLVRKICAIAAVGISHVPSYLTDSLAAMQNDDDGGWGYQKYYGSNNLETALALKALKSAMYDSMAVLADGVDHLTINQNADGGWSFVVGDSSRVFFTAHAILALAAVQGDFAVATNINNGVAWLKTQDHGDGGFGTGTGSNPYETGLAMAAITKGDPGATELTAAMTYLESTQLGDGSWDSDAYSTAMAIYGLNYIGPDLSILTSDIVLSNPTPVDSDLVDISATVRNNGVQDADTVVVQIFDGHPDFGGVQLGTDDTISVLLAGGDSTINVTWDTYWLAGDHDIYVFVDPFDSIREPENLNNTARKSVHVFFPPDLTIADSGIVFNPPEPDTGDVVHIITTFENNGEVTAYNIIWSLWENDPDAGGIKFYTGTISSIPPGSRHTTDLNMGTLYFKERRDYVIYACADRDNNIREISELNNCNFDTLHVGLQLRTIASKTGLNLLGLPLEPLDPITSYTMLPGIPYCNEIDGWDRAGQRWLSAIDIDGGVIIGDEFAIGLREGFFSRVIDSGNADFRGRRSSIHGCTYLEPGYNIVSIPNEDACYSGFSLIDDIATCVQAHAWDPKLQLWVDAAKIDEGLFIGEDFPIYPGYGFFVKVGAGGNWCTHACDTFPVPELPDLLITSDDIWLDPNPVTSGDSVLIAINMTNIGGDSAFTPRLDAYAGDPAAGGTLLFNGIIPDTLGPGEASGYYGLKRVFGGSGIINIYGIADIANVIPEENESNNKASTPLQINAGALASGLSPEVIGESPPIQQLVSQGASLEPGQVTLVRNIDVQPPSMSANPVNATGSDGNNNTPAATALAVSREVTRIADVVVGNLSSSSATIAWATDAPSLGCIHFGPTPMLGVSACETGPADYRHMVVLERLSANTAYYFEVTSGGITDDNAGSNYMFRTALSGAGMPFLIYGRIEDEGTRTDGEYHVFCSLNRGANLSHPLIKSFHGNDIWLLNLGNLKEAASGQVLPNAAGDTIVLEVLGPMFMRASDTIIVGNASPQDCGILNVSTPIECGDINGSGQVDIGDVVTLINYIFRSPNGAQPLPISIGDVDCSGTVSIGDVVYLINYIFRGGLPPCDGC